MEPHPDRLRFSGPELTELLDRVMVEHGENAAISAVNRVRSGGVAGFFCREEFEVVVDPEAADGAGDAEAVDDGALEGEDGGGGAEAADDGGDPQAGAGDGAGEPGSADGDIRGPGDLDAGPERTGPAARPPARLAYQSNEAEEPAPVFGGPKPPGGDRERDRFLTLLERRLEETAAAEADHSLRRFRATGRDQGQSGPPPAPAPVAPAPAAPLPTGAEQATDRAPDRSRSRRSTFWARLDEAEAELDSFVPDRPGVTAVVGPLPLATAVVRRLADSIDDRPVDVVVLTDRAGIVSEPSWRLVRTGNRLVRLVLRRFEGPSTDPTEDGVDLDQDSESVAVGDPQTPLMIVIDVPGDAPADLPSWVTGLQHRLRAAGVGLFRYAVSGRPSGSELERYRQGSDVPYAIDLTARVDPARVVELVADRHPIVSVAGTDLTPELLVALRRHVEGHPDDPGSGVSGG